MQSNGGDGIDDGSLIAGNTAVGNQGAGLRQPFGATYRDNTVAANAGGAVAGSGVNLGGNSCNGTPTCP